MARMVHALRSMTKASIFRTNLKHRLKAPREFIALLAEMNR
jgi:hypothetical protein